MTKAKKAQRLVDEGGVHIMGRDDVCIEGRVGRNEEGRAYHTFLYPDGTACCNCDPACPRVTDLCVHALAVKLTVEKGVGDGKA